MAYTNLKQEIDNYVYENHENEILGKNLQKVLKDMVDVLGDGYRFMGVARTNTTIPAPEEQVFYLVGNGEYGNFGSTKTVPLGYIGVMYYDTQWNMSLINLNLNALNLNNYEGGSAIFSNRGLARQSVPNDLRHKGLIISYVANGIQYCELCINSASATWGDDASWFQIYPFNSASIAHNSQTGYEDLTINGQTTPLVGTQRETALHNQLSQEIQNAVAGIEPIVIEGDVVNAPDEVFLTQIQQGGNSVITLKDKPGSALSNGKGYKILREGSSFASQVTEVNTIYDIRYDFTLAADFSMPADCVLLFNGGSLRGTYSLIGKNTTLKGMAAGSLLCDFAGTFTELNINADVVGLVAESEAITNQQSKFEKLANLIQCTKIVSVQFNAGYYGFGGGSTSPGKETSIVGWYNRYALDIRNGITESLTIKGNGTKFINLYPYYIGAWNFDLETPTPNYNWGSASQTVKQQIASIGGGFLYMLFPTSVNVTLEGFEIDANRSIHQFGGNQDWTELQCGIFLVGNGGNVLVKNIYSHGNVTDGFLAQNAKASNNREFNFDSVTIIESTFSDNMSSGCSPCSGKIVVVDGCNFENNGQIFYVKGYKFEGPWVDMDIEPNPRSTSKVIDVNITNCHFSKSNSGGIVSLEQLIRKLNVTNCTFESASSTKKYTAVTRDGITDYDVSDTTYYPYAFTIEGVIDDILIDNIVIKDSRFIIPQMGEDTSVLPSDTTQTQFMFTDFATLPSKSVNIGRVLYNQINNPQILGDFGTVPYNYEWNVTNQKWVKKNYFTYDEVQSVPAYFAKANISDLIVNVKTPCQLFSFSGNARISFTRYENLIINLSCAYTEANPKLFAAPGGYADMTGRVHNLEINDYFDGTYSGEIRNQGNAPIDYPFFDNIQYNKRKGTLNGIRWGDKSTVIALSWDVYDNGIYHYMLTSDRTKYVGVWSFRPSNPEKGIQWFVTNDVYVHIDSETTETKSNIWIVYDGSKWTDLIGREVTR